MNKLNKLTYYFVEIYIYNYLLIIVKSRTHVKGLSNMFTSISIEFVYELIHDHI